MRRYNIFSRILLFLSVITFALAAPALVKDKRQACVDEVHEDVITVLGPGKRTLEEEMNMLWRYRNNVWRNRNPGVLHLQRPAPPPNVPPPNVAEVQVPEAHAPPQGPADSDRESTVSDDDAPPGSPESGRSDLPPTNAEGSTESEDWNMPSSSLGSSTKSESDAADRSSSISNALSTEAESEAADSEMKGKAKVSRRIPVPPVVLTR